MVTKANKKEPVKKSTSTGSKNDVEEGKVCALLAYLLIGIIWYFVDENMKKNNFVKYHVKQGLVLLIFGIVGSIAISILAVILVFASPTLAWLIGLAFDIIMLIFFILGIVNSLNGQEKELPVIGQFGKKFTF